MRTPGVGEGSEALGIEIGAGDEGDLALALQVAEHLRGFEVARHVIVPPVELDEVEPFHAEAGRASGRWCGGHRRR